MIQIGEKLVSVRCFLDPFKLHWNVFGSCEYSDPAWKLSQTPELSKNIINIVKRFKFYDEK